MKQVTGWWFASTNKKLAHEDNRKIEVGVTHKIDPPIQPCFRGLHLSKEMIDALKWAPGPIIYKVRGSGIIVPNGDPVDKYACSRRTYVDGGVDCTDVLRKFARMCALDVVHLWDAPDVVVEYLKTGDEKLRQHTFYGAWASAWGVAQDDIRNSAIWYGAWATAQVSSGYSAWFSARGSARNSAWAIARASAEYSPQNSAWYDTWMHVRDSARNKQNKRLTKMVTTIWREKGL